MFLGDMHVPVVWGADIAAKEKSPELLPVIVFSHGLGACRYFYSMLCLQLASHGIVVGAIEHRYQINKSTFALNINTRICLK